jgi:hypothetical protein
MIVEQLFFNNKHRQSGVWQAPASAAECNAEAGSRTRKNQCSARGKSRSMPAAHVVLQQHRSCCYGNKLLRCNMLCCNRFWRIGDASVGTVAQRR